MTVSRHIGIRVLGVLAGAALIVGALGAHALISSSGAAPARAPHAEAPLLSEQAFEQRDPGLSDLKTDPLFRSILADPRWRAFLRKMGFAD